MATLRDSYRLSGSSYRLSKASYRFSGAGYLEEDYLKSPEHTKDRTLEKALTWEYDNDDELDSHLEACLLASGSADLDPLPFTCARFVNSAVLPTESGHLASKKRRKVRKELERLSNEYIDANAIERIRKHYRVVGGSICLRYQVTGHALSLYVVDNYYLPASSALITLAGIYGIVGLFTKVLFAGPDPKLDNLVFQIRYQSFCSDLCIRDAVHIATTKGVLAQRSGTNIVATLHLDRAHQLLGAHLQTFKDLTIEGALDVFKQLISLVEASHRSWLDHTDNIESSRYAGILTGICVAGGMRYCNNELARAGKDKARFTLIFRAVLIAVGGSPVIGGYLEGVLSLLVDPIASELFDKPDIRPHILQIGAALEDSITADPGKVDSFEFCVQLEKTMRQCGYSY